VSFWKKPSLVDFGNSSQAATSAPVAPAKTGSEALNPQPEPGLTIGSGGSQTEDAITARYGKIRSALGQGTVIQGKLSFDTPVRIDGRLSGEVYSSKALIVGKTGQIDAHLEVASLIVMGAVSGKIKATERIEIWSGGRLSADISTPVLVVAEGCFYSGACSMPAAKK
jgi:cytoskeletal protein CcmA (bactofilin family)